MTVTTGGLKRSWVGSSTSAAASSTSSTRAISTSNPSVAATRLIRSGLRFWFTVAMIPIFISFLMISLGLVASFSQSSFTVIVSGVLTTLGGGGGGGGGVKGGARGMPPGCGRSLALRGGRRGLTPGGCWSGRGLGRYYPLLLGNGRRYHRFLASLLLGGNGFRLRPHLGRGLGRWGGGLRRHRGLRAQLRLDNLFNPLRWLGH